MARISSLFFQHSPDILCVVQSDGVILEVNAAWTSTLFSNDSELAGHSIFDLFPFEDRELVRGQFNKVRISNATGFFEGFVTLRNGAKKYLSWSVRFDGGSQTFFLSARDRTDYHASVIKLEHDRRQTDAAITSMKEGVVTLNAQGEVVQFNPAAAEILDVSLAEMIGKVPDDVRVRSKTLDGRQMPDEIHPCVMALTTGLPQENVVMGICKRNGEMRWFSTTAIPLFLPGEKLPYQVVNTLRDVTVERNSLAALEQKEREISSVMNRLPALVAYWDCDLKNVFANQAVISAYGENVTSLKGIHIRDIFGEAKFKDNEIYVRQALKGREQTFDSELPGGNGQTRHVLASYIPNVQDGEIVGFYTVMTDVSRLKNLERERREYESKFIAASKMSALGEMAAGIAHEINNPLAIINGKTSLLQTRIEKGLFDQAKFVQDLISINATVERIAKTVRGLLSFSRNNEAEKMSRANLQNVVEGTLDLCREKMRNRGIELHVDVDPNLHIECRATQISQILMNLINNSCDAVENCEKPWIAIRASISDGRAYIRVSDSGPLIPTDVIEKIMNPFFTTKELGKGTGLGLSISKGLAEAHGGQLYFDRDHPNTCFLLELPLSHQGAKPLNPSSSKSA